MTSLPMLDFYRNTMGIHGVFPIGGACFGGPAFLLTRRFVPFRTCIYSASCEKNVNAFLKSVAIPRLCNSNIHSRFYIFFRYVSTCMVNEASCSELVFIKKKAVTPSAYTQDRNSILRCTI